MRERQSSGVDIPSPLRVIKRGKSMQVLSPRKISSASDSLDEGPDQPLTVVKRRKSKANIMRNQSSINELESIQDLRLEENQPNVVRKTASCLPYDPITPKASKVPASRRSSSLHVGRPLSPTFLTKLRSLSTRRSISSKTTRRRNDSRILSESSDESLFRLSDENASRRASALIDYPYLNGSETSSFDGNSFTSDQSLDTGTYDLYMLVPHISITPEAKTLNDGQSNIWMAVEISGQLSRPRISNSAYDDGATQLPFIPTHHCDPSLSRYGYLYNIKVDILPTIGNSVVDLVGDTTVSTVSPGSSLLVLACIRLGASKGYQPRAYKRNSDNLMSDIEFELGDIKVEYARVRLSYCHSGFPAFQDVLTGDTSICHTQLETVTTGVINRHNPVSAWSPQPTPISNPLFAIIASHWGPARANDVMHRIVSSRSSRRKIHNWTGSTQPGLSEDTIIPPIRTGTAPPIPGRYGSLRQLSPQKIADPARKLWAELRQTSSSSSRSNRPASRPNKTYRVPANTTTFIGAPPLPNPGGIITRPESTRPEPSKLEVHRQRELIRETAVRNKRSIGADSLKSLVPSVPEATASSQGGYKENYVPDSPSPSGKEDMHFDGRKREGRWSLGSWWQ